jgi:hypothetical protein
MKNQIHVLDFEHALGVFGLGLLLAVAWLANRGYTAHDTTAGRVGASLARRALDAIGVIGWLIDHLPRSAATHGGL